MGILDKDKAKAYVREGKECRRGWVGVRVGVEVGLGLRSGFGWDWVESLGGAGAGFR